MASNSRLINIALDDFSWLNKPSFVNIQAGDIEVITEMKTDFWQGTWYGFHHNSGHLFHTPQLQGDITITTCVEADFSTLYDQAGLMLYIDEKHWLKAGIEFNDGQPMIGTVLTNGVSDWATGVFTGNPRKFWIRLIKKGSVACVKYSTNGETWTLLRLCPLPPGLPVVGLMCCSPTREGLRVKFSDIQMTEPIDDILHAD